MNGKIGSTRRKLTTRNLVMIGMLSAIGVILSTIEIAIIPGNSHLKIDLSDIPTVLATLLFGVPSGVFVSLIKNLVSLMSTNSFGIGQLINFILGVVLAISLKYTYVKYNGQKTKKFTFGVTFIVSVFAFVLVGALLNIALTPLFFHLTGIPINMKLIMLNVFQSMFFNILKPLITLTLAFPVFNAVKKIL